MKVAVNGKQVDLAKALPLLTRDLRALSRRGISVDRTLEERDVEGLFQMAVYVLQKAEPSVTEEDVDALTTDEFAGLWKAIEATAAALRASDPLAPSSSTSSAAPSGGPSGT